MSVKLPVPSVSSQRIDRRKWLLSVVVAAFAGNSCTSLKNNMNSQKTCKLRVQVLSAVLIERFSGEALWAGVRPRYVVAVLLLDTKSHYQPHDSDFELTTHRMAFFAIDSVTKVFKESDVVGKEYSLDVRSEVFDQTTRFFLSAE